MVAITREEIRKAIGTGQLGGQKELEDLLIAKFAAASNDPVANIAALTALDVSGIENGDVVTFLGFTSRGDGGGGQAYYDPDATDTPDGGTIWAPDVGPGRWFRLMGIAKGIKMEWFDTLANCITYANANYPITVFFPIGSFSWAGVARPLSGVSMIGAGSVHGGAESSLGTRITGVVDQNVGQAYSTYWDGIYFIDGLRLRKQHNTVGKIYVNGEGLSLNKDGVGSCYYTKFLGPWLRATDGNTALTFGPAANASEGNVHIWLPINGRGIEVDQTAGGNDVGVSWDYEAGDPTPNWIRSKVYDNGIGNKFRSDYSENRKFPVCTDGAQWVSGPNASRPSFKLAQNTETVYWAHTQITGKIEGAYGLYRRNGLTPVYIAPNDAPIQQLSHGSLTQVYLPDIFSWGARPLTIEFVDSDNIIKCFVARIVLSVVIATAGTGYSADDMLTVSGGTSIANNMGGPAIVRVLTVGGSGEVLTAEVVNRGYYTAKPANDVSVAGGGGSGAQLTLTWNDQSVNFQYIDMTVVGRGTMVLYPRIAGTAGLWFLQRNSDVRVQSILNDLTPSLYQTINRMVANHSGSRTVSDFDSTIPGQRFEYERDGTSCTIATSGGTGANIHRVDGVAADLAPTDWDIIRGHVIDNAGTFEKWIEVVKMQ